MESIRYGRNRATLVGVPLIDRLPAQATGPVWTPERLSSLAITGHLVVRNEELACLDLLSVIDCLFALSPDDDAHYVVPRGNERVGFDVMKDHRRVRSNSMLTARKIAICTISALCVGACSGSKPPVPPTPTLRTVTVTGVPTSLFPPATAQLTATATMSDNSTQNVTTTATWESTNTAVASVAAGGLVTARAPGSADIAATFQSVRGAASVTVGAPTLTARPGGPYLTQHNTNVTFSGVGSTSSPYPIAKYSWNCGQSVATNCDQEGPTPTFNYRKCGISGRPACRSGSSTVADYTVRLTITDTQGNTSTGTTTVTVTNSY